MHVRSSRRSLILFLPPPPPHSHGRLTAVFESISSAASPCSANAGPLRLPTTMMFNMSSMLWTSRGPTSYAYKILQDPFAQLEVPIHERRNAVQGCCGLGIICGCSQLPPNYLPGIKSYDVPLFLKDSISQDDWKALVVTFNRGMSDVRCSGHVSLVDQALPTYLQKPSLMLSLSRLQFLQSERPWG